MTKASDWRPMSEYQPGTFALFWVSNGTSKYAVYGVLEQRGYENEERIWDNNDFGYGLCADVQAWAPMEPPPDKCLQ